MKLKVIEGHIHPLLYIHSVMRSREEILMKFYGYSIIVDIGEKHESSGFSRGGCTLKFYIFTSFKAEHLKNYLRQKIDQQTQYFRKIKNN